MPVEELFGLVSPQLHCKEADLCTHISRPSTSSMLKCKPEGRASRHLGWNPTQSRWQEGRLGHEVKREYFQAVYGRYR